MSLFDLLKKVEKSIWGNSDAYNKKKFLDQISSVGGKVLDLGANDGDFSLEVKSKAKASQVYTLEINPRVVKELKSKGIKVTQHDLNNPFPYKDEFFSLVTANQVVEHLYHTDDFLKEIYRCVKPGGNLVISTTNLAAWHYRLMLLFGQEPICLHPAEVHFGNFLKGKPTQRYGHKSIFTHTAFCQFVQWYGFEIVDSYTTSFYPIPEPLGSSILKFIGPLGTYSTVLARKPKSAEFLGA